MKCCSVSPEHCRDKFKIDIFSYQISNEKIARRVMRKHLKSEAHAFHLAEEGEKELRFLDGPIQR